MTGTKRRKILWVIVAVIAVGGALGGAPSHKSNSQPEQSAAEHPRKTVENMCDVAAAQIEKLAPHTPGYVYTAFKGCMTWREAMQRAGLRGDLDIASEQWLRMQCAGKPSQGWCAR